MRMISMAGLNKLPDDCLTTISCLTTPRDACRLSVTCGALRSAAESDLVWQKFLPSDYEKILSEASILSWDDSCAPILLSQLPVDVHQFGSKKELFFFLCNDLFIDGGNKIFKLERSTGRKSYIFSAKALSITWGDIPMYWSWRPTPGSRFQEVAELRTTSWLEIQAKIKTKNLSPNTTYGAFLIIMVSERAYGLDTLPMQVSVQVGKEPTCTNNVMFIRQGCDSNTNNKEHHICPLFYSNYGKPSTTEEEMLMKSTTLSNQPKTHGPYCGPCSRQDGCCWLEIDLGHFFVHEEDHEGDDKEVKMTFTEVKGCHLKGGLIVQGLEIRPTS